ncbi:hypothetical protein [Shewanella waksmanii]|uniref:hypothetical protein n=1 Tax=Shewanella waksmanii TaxID=213783 RepID=UPI003735F3FB
MRLVKPLRLFCIAASSLLVAQAHAGLEQDLAKCAQLNDKLDRLICYDNLAANIAQSPQSYNQATSAVTTQSTVQTSTPVVATVSAEESFGNVKKANSEEVEQIQLVIKSVAKDPYGALKVTFENGQVWKQSDSKRYKLKAGEQVTIKKGSFGSYFLGVEHKNATMKVKRIK